MKSLLIYFASLVALAYLIVAFIIGCLIGMIPFMAYQSITGPPFNNDLIIQLIFRGIPALAAGGGLVYLAQLPLKHLYNKLYERGFFDKP